MSTDTTEQRAREVMMSAFDVLSKTEASLPGIVADAQLAALAAANIRLAGEGEVVVEAGRFERLRQEALAHAGCRVVRSYLGSADFQPGDLDQITTQPVTADDTQGEG